MEKTKEKLGVENPGRKREIKSKPRKRRKEESKGNNDQKDNKTRAEGESSEKKSLREMFNRMVEKNRHRNGNKIVIGAADHVDFIRQAGGVPSL